MVNVPHTVATLMAGRNYDLSNPRRTEERCARDESFSKEKLGMVLRASAASANGLETLGLFAAAVVAANVARVPVYDLNILTLGYLVSRAFYNLTYVFLQRNRRFAPLRSVFWYGLLLSAAAMTRY
jgi:uncharacterized MAPEG superfamily protein